MVVFLLHNKKLSLVHYWKQLTLSNVFRLHFENLEDKCWKCVFSVETLVNRNVSVEIFVLCVHTKVRQNLQNWWALGSVSKPLSREKFWLIHFVNVISKFWATALDTGGISTLSLKQLNNIFWFYIGTISVWVVYSESLMHIEFIRNMPLII